MYRATTTLDIPYIKEGLEKLMFGGIASAVVKAEQHQAALLNNITIKQHQSDQATATFRPKVCLRAAIVKQAYSQCMSILYATKSLKFLCV